MMNVFASQAPLATQLMVVMDVAGCNTFTGIQNRMPQLCNPYMGLYDAGLEQAIEPWREVLHDSSGHSPRDVYEAELKGLKDAIIAEVRPKLDKRVQKIFSGKPNAWRIQRAMFYDSRNIEQPAKQAMEGGVISPTVWALMSFSITQMVQQMVQRPTFYDLWNIQQLAKRAMESEVISPTVGALMLDSAAQMAKLEKEGYLSYLIRPIT